MFQAEFRAGQNILDKILENKLGKGVSFLISRSHTNKNLEILPIVMFFGLAGSGKSTIWKLTQKYLKCRIIKIITLTNRPIRPNEDIDNRQWHCDVPNQKEIGLSNLEYREFVINSLKKKNIEMLELDIRETGYFYGVSSESFENALIEAKKNRGLVFLEIDVRGLGFIKNYLQSKNQSPIASIFITNPSFEKMYERFKLDRDHTEDRLKKNITELEQVPTLADLILINYDDSQEIVGQELANYLNKESIKFYQPKAL